MPPATGEAERIRAYYGTASWRASAGRRYLVDEWRELVAKALEADQVDMTALRVCDVGCGSGADLAFWRSLGAQETNLAGTELLDVRASTARQALPAAAIERVDGFAVPFADGAFDLVTASLVFSSILDPAGRAALAAEMRRVARPRGLIAVYDFRVRKPWNRQVRAVGTAELGLVLGQPWRHYAVSPFLPFLDLALHLPDAVGRAVVRGLPRTHRLWLWRA